MRGARRGGPWTLAPYIVALLVTVSSLLVMSRPALGGSDLLATANGGNSQTCGAGVPGNAFDTNDATSANATGSGFYICQGSSAASFTLAYMRILYGIPASGSTNVEFNVCSGALFLTLSGADVTPGTHDTGVIPVGPIAGVGCIRAVINGGSGTFAYYSIEAYATAPVTTVDPEIYCEHATVTHPAFSWVATCFFGEPNLTTPGPWSGTITVSTSPSGSFETRVNALDPDVTRNTTTVYNGPFGPNLYLGKITVSQACLPLCQSDHITMAFHDTTNSHDSTLTFDRSVDGDVIVTNGPHLTQASGCYNASLNSCAAPLNSAAATLRVSYTLEGDASNIYICPWDFTQDGGFGACSATRYVATAQAAGTHIVTVTGAVTTDGLTWMVGAVNRAGTTYLGFKLTDFTSSVTTVQQGNSLTAPPNSCSLTDPGCILRELFSVAVDAMTKPLGKAVAPLQSAMLAKQPFNYILRAVTGVQAQLTRALTETSATNTCPGYQFVMPSPPVVHYTDVHGVAATNNPWPTGVPAPSFTVLKCADLETIMGPGTAWGDWIRPALDPALALAFGLVQFRRLVPRLQMGA